MSQLSLVNADLPAVVDSLIVELSDDRLLIPMSAVAEVVREVKPQSDSSMPQWMYGWLDWRHMRIPLCSFEGLSGKPAPALPVPAHALVVNTLNGGEELPFFGLLIQNFPGPVRVAEDDDVQQVEMTAGETDSAFLMKLILDKQTAFIPDLEKVEQLILKYVNG